MFPVSSSAAGGPGPAAVPVGSAGGGRWPCVGPGRVRTSQRSLRRLQCSQERGPQACGAQVAPRTEGDRTMLGGWSPSLWRVELMGEGKPQPGPHPPPPSSQACRSLQLCPAEAARACGSLCEAVPSSQGARGTPPRSPGATGRGLGSSQGGAEWAGGSPQRGQLRPHSRSLSFSAARPAPGPQPPPRCVHRNLRAPLSL